MRTHDNNRALRNALLYLMHRQYEVIESRADPVPRIRVKSGGTLPCGKHVFGRGKTTMAGHVCGCTVVWDAVIGTAEHCNE